MIKILIYPNLMRKKIIQKINGLTLHIIFKFNKLLCKFPEKFPLEEHYFPKLIEDKKTIKLFVKWGFY